MHVYAEAHKTACCSPTAMSDLSTLASKAIKHTVTGGIEATSESQRSIMMYGATTFVYTPFPPIPMPCGITLSQSVHRGVSSILIIMTAPIAGKKARVRFR